MGSLAGYLIGAWGGRPLLDRYGRWVHIYPDDLDRADAWFARHGDWAVLICRLIPLLRALINFPAGVAHMPIGRFLMFSVLGSLPWNAALLLGGIALGANYEALYHAVRAVRDRDLRDRRDRDRGRHRALAARAGSSLRGPGGRLTGRAPDGTLPATEHIVFGAG